MKKIISFIVLLASLSVFAQVPQKMSYQAVVRNSTNALVVNTTVGMRISILQDVATGPAIYVETHSVTTNSNGLVSLEIGGGNVVTGDFFGIDWANNQYFVKTETDPTGGSNYTIVGTSQFLSVPYALFALSSATPLQEVLNAGNAAVKTVNDFDSNTMNLTTTTANTSNVAYRGLTSTITGTNGLPRAIQGFANGANVQTNTGIAGFATNSSFLNNGVYGQSNSAAGDNYAVWGTSANAVNGKENRGVMGYARNATATGWNYGVSSWVGGSEVANIALGGYADANPSSAGDNYGVSARASAVTTTGTNYGIYSEADNGAVNYAGFFNGDVTLTGTLVQPSDRKLKKDIHAIASALDKINALQPVSYLYDEEKNKGLHLPKNLQYGFIAQDLERVFPNLVSKQVLNLNTIGKGGKEMVEFDAEGNAIQTMVSKESNSQSTTENKEEFKGINYTGLISILTQGIKEQQEQIEVLKAKNEALEKRMQLIEAQLLKK
ncbi:tail fiber domain-containing protein [Flavobacterium sp. 25HG05S-40]|uniref:tail fiber domain-containing protein n=1 Tax=Flavobacterium sp. 25HG05S-40 TaxID=3458682 RepID=UPI004044191B